MFANHSKHNVLPVIVAALVLASALAILSLLLVQEVSGRMSSASLDPNPVAVHLLPPLPAVAAGDAAATANFLLSNHQSGELAPNWALFQDSLNYADYADLATEKP